MCKRKFKNNLPVLIIEAGPRPHFLLVLLRMKIICIKERNGKLLRQFLTHTRLTAAFDETKLNFIHTTFIIMKTIPDTPMTTILIMNNSTNIYIQ